MQVYNEKKFCQSCGKELFPCDDGNCPFCGCPHMHGEYIFMQETPNMGWSYTRVQPGWMTGFEFRTACAHKAALDGLPWRIINTDMQIVDSGLKSKPVFEKPELISREIGNRISVRLKELNEACTNSIIAGYLSSMHYCLNPYDLTEYRRGLKGLTEYAQENKLDLVWLHELEV